MISKIQPCAVTTFVSKKNNKKYCKLWYPYENSYVLGTPVETFITECPSGWDAEKLISFEHLVAIDRGRIVAVDFNI